MYQARRVSRSEFVPIRNLNYHVRLWGEPAAHRTPLVMVHGWMDVAASYQFVVDAFAQDRYVIAPDWRGYGLTTAEPVDNYWFADYMADLDFLADHFCPGRPFDLVGHSMGGHVVMQYAGARPERIRRLVNLEGFGAPDSRPSEAPRRYARWMDQLKQHQRGELALRPYDAVDGVALRLMKTNPRLTRDKADWLARHWSRRNAQGQWEILGDAAHKITNAEISRKDEILETYKRITAPTLVVLASDNSLEFWWKGRYGLPEFRERIQAVPRLATALVEDAGHMLHHDQPQALARLIEEFIDAP